jgi:hypothetical protein
MVWWGLAWAAEHESDIAGIVPDDWDFANETVPEVVLPETTVVEDGEPAL